jgi:hypothetical protein
VKYQGKSFSVGSTASLRKNWDAVFGKRERPAAKCGNVYDWRKCKLAARHKGAHTDYDVEWINGRLL